MGTNESKIGTNESKIETNNIKIHNKIIMYNNNKQFNIDRFNEKFIKIKLSLLKDFKNLYNITIPGDGHCFFHSILKAIDKQYNKLPNNLKQQRAIELRHNLSLVLQDIDEDGISVYQKMYDGELSNFGIEEYSMINLIKILNSNSWVDLIFSELVSDLFNIDIYVIDFDNDKIYFQYNKLKILYKGRNSIVILYHSGHYELLGCHSIEDNIIYTLFSYDHPLIIYLYNKLLNMTFVRL